MPSTLTVYDETTSGQKSTAVRLEFLKEKITVKELIRERIYQEVQDYNLKQPEHFHGLVQPTEAEKTLNGFKMRKARKIDWEEQYRNALKGFEGNGFFVLIGNRQAESLEQEFEITPDTEVSFVKLVPLVGG
jgi:hypothetical protein